MQFTKMQGLGNDYIYLHDPDKRLTDPAALAVKMSDRRFGIGGDGIILILPSKKASAKIKIFNADGSEAEMCGNAIRCVAKLLRDRGIVREKAFLIETKAGLKKVNIIRELPGQTQVKVDMGPPSLYSNEIPLTGPKRKVTDEPLVVEGKELKITCVSMGNPHCVLFFPKISSKLVRALGPVLENYPLFPNKTNVEFVQVLSEDALHMQVWERGSGETMACGTGACASVVAGRLKGHLAPEVRVILPGGELKITWEGEGKPVFMTGPAVTVFTGEWSDETQSL